ncbi:MFS transporter [Microbacterium oryzae]|uniref:MFS transporter n=1 Tax=Microbacterium oryzae TaxID=743009 RepID=UPI0025AF4F1C|nr:MFS transporter [Microbacterium oryzae]MDN3311957.1 MFS transporter [Microbacterium oryzae]
MRRILLLALAQCAVLGSLTAPAVVGLSILVRSLVGADAAPPALAMVVAAGSATAMVANPLFGWAADRSRVGRRVWLAGGAVAGLLASAAVVFAADAVWLAAAWMLAQAAYNACFGAINGLLSAHLTPQNRTRAAGVFSAASIIGALPGLALAALLPHSVTGMILAVPAVAAVAILLIARRLPDDDGPASRTGHVRPAIRPVLTRPFLAAALVRFVLSVELAAGLTFGLYLFLDRWRLPEVEAVRLVSLATLLGAVGVAATAALIASSPLARADPRSILAVGLVLLAAAMVGRGLATAIGPFLVATAVAGVGIGAGYTATRSLVQAALPPESSAFGLGIFNVANTLAPVVAPLLAGALLLPRSEPWLLDSYGTMYVLLAIPVLACLGALPWLRYSTGSRPMNFIRSSP